MTDYPRFHLALPVTDLEQARIFYGEVLGCAQGRCSERWIDFDFWGHQLVVHRVHSSELPVTSTNPVDAEQVPAGHFGPILPWDEFQPLLERLREHGVEFVIGPTLRFAGRRGEQQTLFVKDPCGNYLEFKAFRNIEMLFATDGLDYP
ncbi:MAG: VOC family protein [Gammaproteobacteria bacterium]|nr:VOC family protein [Gammaproteobacteria bacterium]